MINKKNYFEKKNDILEFIIRYEKEYGIMALWMEEVIISDTILNLNSTNIPVSLAQILSKFNVYNHSKDEYIEMFKLLKEYSLLEGNCCEIGAGRYPRLAELTAPEIKLKNGTLTIYDPNTMISKMENVKIIKDEFRKNTNIDYIDTIYAMYPCEATATIVEKAFEEDKNLMLAFCGCNQTNQKWIGKYWAEDFCMAYREKYGQEVEIINWPSKTGIDLPIMVRHK